MGRVPSLGNCHFRKSIPMAQQIFDPRQFPGAEQADRIRAEALRCVECPHTSFRAATLQAVMQALSVEIEQQMPAVDFDG